ncbi:MAG: CapA family protein, partial [Hyphomicrobiales bacterium]
MQQNSVRLIAGADLYLKGAIPSTLESSPNHRGFQDFVRRIAQADIRFVNLEMVLTTGGYSREKSAVLHGHPDLANHLNALGLDIVTMANNHMMDRGMEGLFSTLDTMDAHGIERVGAGRNLAEAQMPRFIERKGIRLGFLAFSATLPLGAAAAPERPGVNPLHVATRYVMTIPEAGTGNPPPALPMTLAQEANVHDVDALIQAVRAAKADADYLVVAPHWGVVGQDRVMPYQEEVAHALIDAGADAIVGHHPHRLHGVEVYKERPIFYSLGNFIFQLDLLQPVGQDL